MGPAGLIVLREGRAGKSVRLNSSASFPDLRLFEPFVRRTFLNQCGAHDSIAFAYAKLSNPLPSCPVVSRFMLARIDLTGEFLLILSDIFCWLQPAILFLQEQTVERSSLVDLILRSSLISKFVLLVLFLFSIASWAIIFTKSRATKLAEQQSSQFLQAFEHATRWADLHSAITTVQ